MLNKIDNFINRLSDWLLVIVGIFIIIMGFCVTYSVVMRYVFEKPTAAAYELVQMLCVLSAVFAFPAVERYHRNIKMTLIVEHMPKSVNNFLTNIVGPLLGMVFCYVLAWKGFTVGIRSLNLHETTGSTWDVPIYWLKLLIPIAYSLLFCVLLFELKDGIVRILGKKPVIAQNKEQAIVSDQ